jgi:hypothetical protein
LQEIGQGALVTRRLPVDALLIGITPAGVNPDLSVDTNELPVKRLGEKLQVSVGAVGPGRAPVVRRLFDLDEGTASGGEFPQLGVKNVA